MNAKVKSTNVKDVNQSELVVAAAAFLKKSGKLKVPDWADIVKTGIHKELAPIDPDWFYTRCAAVARHLYVRSPSGVGAMTKIFGGKNRRGVRGGVYVRGSSSVARRALQALESIKWIEKHHNGGRVLTSQGVRDLDRIAGQVRRKRSRANKREVLLLSLV